MSHPETPHPETSWLQRTRHKLLESSNRIVSISAKLESSLVAYVLLYDDPTGLLIGTTANVNRINNQEVYTFVLTEHHVIRDITTPELAEGWTHLYPHFPLVCDRKVAEELGINLQDRPQNGSYSLPLKEGGNLDVYVL